MATDEIRFRVMEWRVRIRRALLATGAVLVLAAAGIIPVAVFAAPVASEPRDLDERIPWQLAGTVWNECPVSRQIPLGLAIASDESGAWQVNIMDDAGQMLGDDEVAARFPELTEPLEAFRSCLSHYPMEPYRQPPAFNSAQREMYWAYVLGRLVPCLRDHGREVEIPSHRQFKNADPTGWYFQQVGAYYGSTSLDEAVKLWNECPLIPSYLDSGESLQGG